jgi:hypothetical protein
MQHKKSPGLQLPQLYLILLGVVIHNGGGGLIDNNTCLHWGSWHQCTETLQLIMNLLLDDYHDGDWLPTQHSILTPTSSTIQMDEL